MTNLYFRRRLYAQSFTIAVLVLGNLYWQKGRMKRKDYEKMVAEKDRMDKRERWLKELEMRDEDDKAWKDRMARRVRGDAGGVTEKVREKTEELKNKFNGEE